MESIAKKEIPVLVLTGYLGSGKTTLVNRILTNRQGIKFAVIVNDIGEVNIDAELIQRGGVVNTDNNSLVALQNGCICCTLQTNLIEQVFELIKSQQFDYIVIEASGICDPEPIAQTICTIPRLGEAYSRYGVCKLDCVVTVVDALRMQSEFGCGEALTEHPAGEDDIANLLIQQIEFCNIVLLNKIDEVSKEEQKRITQIIRTLQPEAEIIACNFADVELDKILNTNSFRYSKVAASAGWIQELGKPCEEPEHHTGHDAGEHHHEEHHHEEHCHEGHHHHEGCCCHHHHHEEGEAAEYGIETFVYYRRPAFDMNKFDYFINAKWPRNVIRAKGVCYFNDNPDMTCLFEQAGKQKQLSEVGQWYAAMPEEELMQMFQREPGLLRDWDERYGDRMQKIVFIGQHMDKEQLIADLDACLE